MTTYEPGTVAVATVRDVPNRRVMRTTDNCWTTTVYVDGSLWHQEKHVTDVRPLVVLDVPAMVVPHKMAEALRKYDFLWLADQIEAQTKPPRIPEPGLWGVVLAEHNAMTGKREFFGYGPGRWLTSEGDCVRWDDLIDPVLVRDGVES